MLPMLRTHGNLFKKMCLCVCVLGRGEDGAETEILKSKKFSEESKPIMSSSLP